MAHWKQDNQGDSLRYDCDYCLRSGNDKGKVCFLKKDKKTLRFPVLPAETKYEYSQLSPKDRNIVEFMYKDATYEDVVDYLIKIHKLMPNELVTTIMRSNYFKLGVNGEIVCPMGLITEEASWFVDLESAAAKYHSLPFPGTWLDQPQYIIDAFDACRAAESKYLSYSMSKKEHESTKSKPPNNFGRGRR